MIRSLGQRKVILTLFGFGLALTLLACNSQEPNLADAGQQNGAASGQGVAAGELEPSQKAQLELAEQQRAAVRAAARLGLPIGGGQGIMVSGQGEASAAPDLANLSLGVQAFAQTVGEARDDAATAMGRVTEVLKARNIADRDIQTRSFNINPRYTNREVTRCPETNTSTTRNLEPATTQVAPETPPRGSTEGPVLEIARSQEKGECFKEREQVIIGYEVTNQLSVRLRDLDAVGGVIDEVTEAGGDLVRFQGINFSIEDPEALQEQALAAAVEDVMGKANQIATLSGVQLGKLIHISETSGQPRVPSIRAERVAFASVAKGAPTPIMAGELEVRVNVQALYGIQ